jgi:hypothetical protein
MPRKKKAAATSGSISLQSSSMSPTVLGIIAKRTSKDSKILVGGVPIPESFYVAAESAVSEEDFRDNNLPVIVKYGKELLHWSNGSVGAKMLSDAGQITFRVSNHVDRALNPWVESPSAKTMESFRLLNERMNGPRIEF